MTTDTIINQAIETSTEATPIEASNETQVTEENEPKAISEDIPFPKKAVNAISRRDRQIGKYRAQLAQMEQELTKYRQEPPKSDEPNEADYQNYGDYLKAVAKNEARKEFQGEQKKTQESQRSMQEQVWRAQREENVAEMARSLIETNPEYKEIFMESSDIIGELPPHIEHAFLEAENAPLAIVVLAREGKLEELANMSPYRAAMEIAKAEARGENLTKKVTKAPQPIASAKGTGPSTKSLANMTAKELTAWVKS